MSEHEEFMKPFVEAAQNVFETMLMLSVEWVSTSLKEGDDTMGDVSGVMGTSEGGAEGLIVISMPQSVALKVAAGFLGLEPEEIDDDVKECMRELTNMVAGGAKSKLDGSPYFFMLSIPTVITGKELKIHHKPDHRCVLAEMSLDGEKFVLEVSMKEPDDE